MSLITAHDHLDFQSSTSSGRNAIRTNVSSTPSAFRSCSHLAARDGTHRSMAILVQTDEELQPLAVAKLLKALWFRMC